MSYSFPPLNSVAALRPYYFATALKNAGMRVTVLTAAMPESKNELSLDISGLEVIRAPSPLLNTAYRLLGRSRTRDNKPSHGFSVRKAINEFRIKRGLGVLGRMPDLADFWIYPSLRMVRGRSWDVVISTYAPYAAHAIAYRLRKTGQTRRWIADYRDLWTNHHQFSGLYPFTMIERRLERRYLRYADHLTSVSPHICDELHEQFHKPAECIQGGFNPAILKQIDPTPILHNEKFTLVYTGTLYDEHPNLDALLDALQQVNEKDHASNLKLIFAGSNLCDFHEMIRKRRLHHLVEHIGQVAHDYALRLQRDADALIFLDNDEHTGVTTGKIFEYIHSGTPIWRIGNRPDSVASIIVDQTKTALTTTGDTLREILHGLNSQNQSPILEPNNDALRTYQAEGIAEQLKRLVKAS